MKKLSILACILLVSNFIIGQEINEAPATNEFIQYQKEKQNIGLDYVTSSGRFLGEQPSPVKYNFTKKSNSLLKAAQSEIPASYDLRSVEEGAYLSSVKNQGNAGCCWTFATYGAIESYLLKHANITCDFSEQNLANCHGFNASPTSGGNKSYAMAYLSRLSGPINETQDPYTLPENPVCIETVNPARFVQQGRYMPGSDEDAFNADDVKRALMEYGAISVNLYYDDDYYSRYNYTYHYNGSKNTNHAVLLVGWDDNKDVTGGSSATPSSKGAWIIRNSWGEYWGESGYFYVSYEDTKVLTSISYFPSNVEFKNNVKAYYYDETGMVGSFGYGKESAYGLVKFTIGQNETIDKIGVSMPSDNGDIEFEIYGQFDGHDLSEYLGGVDNLKSDYPGFYTFDLPTPVLINTEKDIYIKYKVTTPGYNYPIAYETLIDNYNDYSAIEEGKCWVSSGGIYWSQVGEGTSYQRDLSLKVYTSTDTGTSSAADDNLYGKVRIYPNPTNGILKIETGDIDASNALYSVIDLTGKTIIESTPLNNDITTLDLSNQTVGIYFVKVTSAEGSLIKKVVVK